MKDKKKLLGVILGILLFAVIIYYFFFQGDEKVKKASKTPQGQAGTKPPKNNFSATTKPPPASTPYRPPVSQIPVSSSFIPWLQYSSRTLSLQKHLNRCYLKEPKLKEDGVLGNKTAEAFKRVRLQSDYQKIISAKKITKGQYDKILGKCPSETKSPQTGQVSLGSGSRLKKVNTGEEAKKVIFNAGGTPGYLDSYNIKWANAILSGQQYFTSSCQIPFYNCTYRAVDGSVVN